MGKFDRLLVNTYTQTHTYTQAIYTPKLTQSDVFGLWEKTQ